MGIPEPQALERAALQAWPGLEVEWDGAWVRRAANGYTKRANSVQSHDPADEADAPHRLAASRDWFETRGLSPCFRVNPLTGPRVVSALDAADWRAHDRSLVLARALEAADPDPRARALAPLDPVFLAAQRELQGYDEARTERLAAILGALDLPAVGMVLVDRDAVVAAALFDIADGIMFAGNVVTAPAERRKGYGRSLMQSGLAWGCAQGARVASHNVQADNDAAIRLYESLGYRLQYDYVYRTAPAT